MAAILPRQLDRLEEHEFPKGFNPKAVRAFLDETSASGGAELANSQSIIRDLCKVLGVAAPKLKHAGADNPYCFEEDVKEGKAHRRIDVYKRGCFVLEAKQGADPKAEPADALARSAAKAKVGHSKSAKGAGTRGTAAWVEAMKAGFFQAAAYAVNVTQRKDPKPPFVVVMDLGHRFWIWSSFQPDAKDDYGDFELEAGFAWEDLLRPEVFKFLRQVWETPEELNEEVQGQRVTAEIAAKVSDLALRLEKRLGKKSAERVGDFLMKCVFTMFAEDVGMIPRGLLTRRLDEWLLAAKAGKPDRFVKGLRSLWSHMNDGGDLDSGETIRRFNGYLFKNPEPIELALDELEALRATAAADWRRVSPAIFGTLLERALTPEERHKLGAHYTPEAYIRRLVDRTMMAPLRVEWRNARAEMEKIQLTGKVKQKAEADAMKVGLAFRTRLATVRVLDPACGSGNFLYVALKELKRLEGEVDRALRPQKGYKRAMDFQGESVHPVQFHGIELKPWAAKVAELVLWIGYLQWQVTAGRFQAMQEPLIQDLHHIECRDALITWKKAEAVVDEDGAPVLRAIGVSDKKAERRMVPVERLVGVKVAPWPEADFVVGNPPFLGNKRLNDVLPPGYVEAIKAAYPEVPGTADLVMWWWWRCAALVGAGKLQRFGLVTTNSITQTSNRAVATAAIEKGGLRLAWAIPDHPWYDEGAAVRIAMTVAEKGGTAPLFGRVVDETATAAAELEQVKVEERTVEEIHPDLSVGAKVTAAVLLKANEGLALMGMTLLGEGFRLTPEEVEDLGYNCSDLPAVIRGYCTGKEVVQRNQARFVIDFFGLSKEAAREQHPRLFNHLLKTVKPIREAQNDAGPRERWWIFGRTRPELRDALKGLKRYIVTPETSKHRVFTFLPAAVTSDHSLYVVASDASVTLGVLSSRVHLTWASAAGSTLEDRPRWRNQACFDPFPFPAATDAQRVVIGRHAEALDAYRKARQAEHSALTLTATYNVVAKLRSGELLTAEDEKVRAMSMADTVLDLHDQLDRAVADAYGWPHELPDGELLTRLVALNAVRAAEEAKGVVRWLRPDLQAPQTAQAALAIDGPKPGGKKPTKKATKAASKLSWPAGLPGRIEALVTFLRAQEAPWTAAALAEEGAGATLADMLLTLQCAAAAQAVTRLEDDEGQEVWAARA